MGKSAPKIPLAVWLTHPVVPCWTLDARQIRRLKAELPQARVVVCRDDVRRVKPHPEHIRLALDRLDALPDNTLMVGDHPIDITTGRNARTLTCGVLTCRCPKENFVAAGADLVLDNAAEILSILKIADG